MKKQNKFVIVGGDKRMLSVSKYLKENGFEVSMSGFDKLLKDDKDPAVTLETADFILFPTPLFSEEKIISTPFGSEKLDFCEVLKKIRKDAVIFGKAPEDTYGHIFIDYSCREDFQTLNAVPTAEGAIAAAINETDCTLFSSRCLVIGFGRIGKLLSLKLSSLGADVTVAARKEKDLSMISSLSMTAVNTGDIEKYISDKDIIFNTVPFEIIKEKELKKAKKTALFIDLASKPGGIDFKTAETNGFKVLWLLSLPGKTAPETAGKIIALTIIKILKGGTEIDR